MECSVFNPSKLAGAEASDAPKHPGKICLAAEAQGPGNVTNRSVRIHQKQLGPGKTQIVDDGLVTGPTTGEAACQCAGR